MKKITPDYYDSFHCIANKCRHNCCIGWEIDIDSDTMEKYMTLESPLGKKLRESISGDMPHFVLSEKERCPFLDDNNLCEIIRELGEEGLCEICHLHPRFINYYDEFFEVGLGLCCEEAGRIVICSKDRFHIEFPDDNVISEQEKNMLLEKNDVFDILQNRKMSVFERFSLLAERYGLEFSFSVKELAAFYLSLERLDDEWTRQLKTLENFSFDNSIFSNPEFSLPFEQLACYFVFRHFSESMYSFSSDVIGFTLMSCFLVGALWSVNNCKAYDDNMIDLVRMYSSEIEYSDENTVRIIDYFSSL